MYLRTFISRSILVFVVLFFTFYSGTIAGPLDSLLNEREKLIQEHNELISTARTSPATDRKVFELQNKLLALDSFIIDDQFLSKAQNLKAVQDQVTELEDDYETLLMLFYIVAAAALVFLILFFIFLASYIGARKKSKLSQNQVLDLQKMLEEYSNELSVIADDRDKYKRNEYEVDKMKEKLQIQIEDYERRGSTNHIEMIRLKSENSKLADEIKDLKEKQTTTSISDNSEIAAKLVRLEKELEEKDNTITEYVEKLNELKNLLEMSEVESNKKEEDEVALQNELDSLKKELVIREKEINSNTTEDFENEINRLRTENKELSDLLKAAEQVQNDLLAEKEDLSVKETASSEEAADADNLRTVLNAQIEELMEVKRNQEELSEANKGLSWKNKILEEELERLKTKPDIKQERKPDNLMVEDLLQQNLDLQNELNEFKKLLDEELENRKELLKEIEDLEKFYKSEVQEEIATKDSISDEVAEMHDTVEGSEYEKLKSENEELKEQIRSFDEKFKYEENARTELENELKELLEQFNNITEDLNKR
ncbi:MAG: hypothetical protein R6U11_01470 [Bacteroidales bacterium]